MDIKQNIGKVILFVFFVIVGLGLCISNMSYVYPIQLVGMFVYQLSGQEEPVSVAGFQIPEIKYDQIKSLYDNQFTYKQMWLEMNGMVAKSLNMKNYYNSSNVYITDSNYIISKNEHTTTDYEYEQVLKLNEYLEANEIQFLYVNAPTKYLNDDIFTDEFAVESYTNRNADTFLKRIKSEGVPYLDLRENIVQQGLDIESMFYRTDHHWTTNSGLWAAKQVALELNTNHGYKIPMDLYEEDRYFYQEYKDIWLGEQGNKVSATRIGMEDFCLILPNFETSYHITNPHSELLYNGLDGTFQNMVDLELFSDNAIQYKNKSLYYSYMSWEAHDTSIHNNLIDKGDILLLSDSYSQVFAPFFSLGVQNVKVLNMRAFQGDLTEYIDENEFDTVIVLYSETMLGAHDDVNNSNYNMFRFME